MSQENTTLEEAQKDVQNTKIAEYNFECEGGGAPAVKSSKLTTHKPSIKLHFFRYGLFHKSTKEKNPKDTYTPLSKSHNQGKETDTIDEVNPADAPPVKDFFYARTALNEGYLYIFDDADPNAHFEYKIDETDGFYPVYWANNKEDGKYKDIRKASSKRLKHHSFKQDTVLWIAYSPVQWSIDYHNKIHTDDQLKKERMVQIKCSGFKKEESGNCDIFPFNEIFGTFYKDEPHGIWFNEKIKDINASDNVTRKTDPEAIKQDMFISLHDPIGALKDVIEHYSHEYLQFKAFVEAIQTGETQAKAFERLCRSEPFDTTKNRDHQYLFALANFSYQHAFGSKKNMDKYSDNISVKQVEKYLDESYLKKEISYHSGLTHKSTETSIFDNGVDLQKLVGILGVDERKTMKEQLQKLRTVAFGFFKGEYAFKFADDYVYNHSLNTLEGRNLFVKLTEVLYACPHQVDEHLELPNKRHISPDNIREAFGELFNEQKLPKCFELEEKSKNPDLTVGSKHLIVALATGKLNVEIPPKLNAKLKEEISIRTAAVIRGIMGVVADRAYTVIRNKKFSTKLFSVNNATTEVQRKIIRGINKGILVNGEELFALTQKGIIATFQDQIYLLSTEGSSAFKLEMVSNTPGNDKVNTIRSQKLTEKQIRNNNLNSKLNKIVDSNAFRGVFGVLAVYNLNNSLGQLRQQFNGRNAINTAGYSADVAQVALSFREKIVKASFDRTTKIGIKTIEKAKLFTNTAGAIGGVLTCAVCMIDSKQLFDENDNDAGATLVAAGIGFAAAGIVPLFQFALGAALTGPIGWGCLLAATALYFLSEVLKDDDFQKIYKHYLLSDYGECPKGGLTPMLYAKKILNQKALLTHPEYTNQRENKKLPNLENPHNAYCMLMEETIMPCIKVVGKYKKPTDTNIFSGWYRNYNIIVPLYNYIQTQDDLSKVNAHAQFYPQHPNSFSNVRTDNVKLNYEIHQDKELGKCLLINVDIDKHTKNVGNGVFCSVYLQIMLADQSEDFFPFNAYDGKQRLIKIKTRLYYSRSNNKLKGNYSIITR